MSRLCRPPKCLVINEHPSYVYYIYIHDIYISIYMSIYMYIDISIIHIYVYYIPIYVHVYIYGSVSLIREKEIIENGPRVTLGHHTLAW